MRFDFWDQICARDETFLQCAFASMRAVFKSGAVTSAIAKVDASVSRKSNDGQRPVEIRQADDFGARDVRAVLFAFGRKEKCAGLCK